MTDIIERLRLVHSPADARPAVMALCAEAAAEIERLRTTLASWEAVAAIARGSLASPGTDSAPAVITNAAPNAPR